MKSKTLWAALAFALFIACVMMFTGEASAESSYFSAYCAACHSNDTASCNGCHSHGVWQDSNRTTKNLTATTDLDRYQPGQTVTVTFGGGYRRGWIRAKLYDQNNNEIDRVTGPTGMGDDGSGSMAQQFPVILQAPAPSTPGFYRWTAAWFGAPFDVTNPAIQPHVEEKVLTNQFEVYVLSTCRDADSDGYEDVVCNDEPSSGGGDCDDTNAAENPGVTEVPYNGTDDDCEPATPDDDLDGDGFGIAQDCDDNDPAAHPGAAEVCDDGVDNDCDGLVDSSDPDCTGPPPVDADSDGYTADVDCDDSNPAVNPGAAEVCDDGIDNDCDGLVDSDDPDCTAPPVDADADGYASDVDCDDSNPAVNPGSAEVCADGIDNDCDGLVDSNDPDCGYTSSVDGRIHNMIAPKVVELKENQSRMRKIKVHVKGKGEKGETSTGTLYLYKNGVQVDSAPITLSGFGPNKNVMQTFFVTIGADDAPSCTWEAVLELPGDPNTSNNSKEATTKIRVKSHGKDHDEEEDDD